MEILLIVKYASLFLGILSLLFTLEQMYLKFLIHGYREIMVEKIISMIQDLKSEGFILKAMTEEGYPTEFIKEKYIEIQNLGHLNK